MPSPPSRPRTGRRPRAGRAADRGRAPQAGVSDTRAAVFASAAELFSERGFDGVTVDDIARRAAVNKAMIYYHFSDKLALYRGVVSEMAREAGGRLGAIAAGPGDPCGKMQAVVGAFVALTAERPWIPPLMLREIAEGAPHLDAATLGLMRAVFLAFARILAEGQERGVFRPVHPVLAYMSALGPLLLNAARERAGTRPGRRRLPMFVEVPPAALVTHMQSAILRLLAKD